MLSRRRDLIIVLILLLFYPTAVKATEWSSLIDRLVADGFDHTQIIGLFARPEVKFEPDSMSKKIEALIKRKSRRSSVASPDSRDIYRSFLQPEIISAARTYAQENEAVLDQITSDYCVPGEIVVAILLVETRLGKNLGDKNAFNTLASMALASDLDMVRPYLDDHLITPRTEDFARKRCRQKSNWAYKELKALIQYAELNDLDPLTIPGSIYGAIGLCQFMPSNAHLFGVDADQDGRVDLFSHPDALFSIGNYLVQSGWTCKMGRKKQYKSIYAYNHSRIYVETVMAVAEKIRNDKNSL